ncbi:MAG: hypothetical protein J1E81_03670 [Eubacterium sp.]|nr:hypothetical protein [Eubacterium sp.]
MSSYNKTKNLKLNQWRESDVPKMADFNYDNEIIDSELSSHTANSEIHIKSEERDRWNEYVFTGVYFGDGKLSRIVETNCPFEAVFGFVYTDEMPPSIHYNDDGSTHHYVSFVSQFGNSIGASINKNNKDITVKNSFGAEIKNEHANLNQNGLMYRYVLFRDNRGIINK